MAAPIDIHPLNVERARKGLKGWRIAEVDRRSISKFLEALELGQVNRGKRISEFRQVKYLYMLRSPLEFMRKPVSRLAVTDIERFEKAAVSGRLLNARGKQYANASLVDIRRALKVFLRWRLGKTRAEKLTGWLDMRKPVKTPDYLQERDVEELLKACRSAEERFLIAVLFDTGARAAEFHNIRFEDVHLPENERQQVKITLKEEYSKTKGRTISLYWKASKSAIEDYLRQRRQEGMRMDEPVYNNTYNAARLFLRRIGWRVLKRAIHFHLFRHSSATYYASKLNRQQLCIRYGWTFSSNMPDVYISRIGMDSAELDEKFTKTTVEELQVRLERKEQEDKLKADRIVELEQKLAVIERNLPTIARIMELKPDRAAVGAALRARRLNTPDPSLN